MPSRRSARIVKQVKPQYLQDSDATSGTQEEQEPTSPVAAMAMTRQERKKKAIQTLSSSGSDFADKEGVDDSVSEGESKPADETHGEGHSSSVKRSAHRSKKKKPAKRVKGQPSTPSPGSRRGNQVQKGAAGGPQPKPVPKRARKGMDLRPNTIAGTTRMNQSVEPIPVGLSAGELDHVDGEHDHLHHSYENYQDLCAHSKQFHKAFSSPGLRQKLLDLKDKISEYETSEDPVTSEHMFATFETGYTNIFNTPFPFKEAFLKIAQATTRKKRKTCVELLYCPAGHEIGINKDDDERCFTDNLMLAVRSLVPRDPENTTIQLLLDYCSRNIEDDEEINDVAAVRTLDSIPVTL
ncbi:hypothetical protein HKX48_008699 [Thoreauomyces humboldtii]|nr:hypothetical protein HKX48_008699 [Thoreauomyces humboldtii]